MFIDKVSGKLARRVGWDACLDYLRPGDQLVVTRRSRVARSVRHLSEVAAELERREVDLVVLKRCLDTASPAGRLLFGMLGAIDEFTTDLISEGTPGRPGRRASSRPDWWPVHGDDPNHGRGGQEDVRRRTQARCHRRSPRVGRTTIYRHLAAGG